MPITKKAAPKKAAAPRKNAASKEKAAVPALPPVTTNPVPYTGDTVIYVDKDGNESEATVQLVHGGMTADLTIMLPAGPTSLAHVPSVRKLSVDEVASGVAHWKN